MSGAPESWLAHFGRRPKIMIVDDQAINIRVLNELFRAECEVIMAMNAEQALLQCQSQRPDLILLDVVMPDIDGHQLCRVFKTQEETANVPIIFVSAQHDDVDEEFGLSLGAVDFISKPIKPGVVRARVNTHLQLILQSSVLRTLARIDGLTGIANRRYFDEVLQANWLQCARALQPLSLIMLDVDYFKRFNDHYGHLEGDRCLQLIAHALQQCLLRPQDMLARFGGEEFVRLMPTTDEEGATLIAERLLNAVQQLEIPHQQSDIAHTVTISLGVATHYPSSGVNAEQLVAQADQLLYAAKNAGRGRMYNAAHLQSESRV